VRHARRGAPRWLRRRHRRKSIATPRSPGCRAGVFGACGNSSALAGLHGPSEALVAPDAACALAVERPALSQQDRAWAVFQPHLRMLTSDLPQASCEPLIGRPRCWWGFALRESGAGPRAGTPGALKPRNAAAAGTARRLRSGSKFPAESSLSMSIERRLRDLQLPQHLREVVSFVEQPFALTDLPDSLLWRVPTSLHDRVHPLIPPTGHDEHAQPPDHITGAPSRARNSGHQCQITHNRAHIYQAWTPAAGVPSSSLEDRCA